MCILWAGISGPGGHLTYPEKQKIKGYPLPPTTMVSLHQSLLLVTFLLDATHDGHCVSRGMAVVAKLFFFLLIEGLPFTHSI